MASFGQVQGIACDKDGNVYVVENYAHFGVRKVTFGSRVVVEAKEPAFSPNGDGKLDADGIRVTSSGNWDIQVKDHPGVLGGVPVVRSGASEFDWTGKVGNVQLQDGEYTLEVQSGSNTATIKVLIDTVKPTVDKAWIPNVEVKVNDENNYLDQTARYDFAVDLVADTGAPIDKNTLRVDFVNSTFGPIEGLEENESGHYRFHTTFGSASADATSLNFNVTLEDSAGNQSLPFHGQFQASFEAAPEIAFTTDDPLADSSAAQYREQTESKSAKRSLLLDSDYVAPNVYYSRSDTQAIINIKRTLNSEPFTTLSIPEVLVNIADGKKYSYGRLLFKADATGKGVVESQLKWNGKWMNSADYAPTGRYDLYLDLHAPWLGGKVHDAAPIRHILRVSGRECATLAKWSAAGIPGISDRNACHLLHRHIVLPHNIPSLKTGIMSTDPPDDVFQYHDASLFRGNPIRPVVQYQSAKKYPAVNVLWSEEWELSIQDKKNRYVETREMMRLGGSHPDIAFSLDLALKIGSEVWRVGDWQEILDKTGKPTGRFSTTAKEAPVVLSKNARQEVIFVRSVVYPTDPANYVGDVIPALDAQTRYEKTL